MLNDAHELAALEHLNAICPNTFDRGEFGPWKFVDLSRDGDLWKLSFKNRETDSDYVALTYAGDGVGSDGVVNQDWFEQTHEAVLE